MNRAKLLFYYRLAQRNIFKIIGGYKAEAKLYLSYPFLQKHVPETKFIIFTYPRTGSSLLVDLLNSHPQISCEGEVLLNRMISPNNFIKLKSRLYSTTAFGFKLHISHMDYQKILKPDQFVREFHRGGYRIIKLSRRNLFKTALSLQYAFSSMKFHVKRSPKDPKYPFLRIDPQEVINSLEWIIYQDNALNKICSQYPHIDIVYEEDLVEDQLQQPTVNRITDYLELNRAKVQTDFVKVTTIGSSHYISNINEIKNYLSTTEYEKYL